MVVIHIHTSLFSSQGYLRSSVCGPRRSLTSFRTSCTTTASVWWRSRCWSPSFQRRLTLPLVRTHTCTHTHTHTHSSAHAQTRGSHWPLHRSLCSSWLLCPDGSQWDRPLPVIRRRLLAAVQPSPFSGQHSVTVSRGGVHTPTAAQWRDGTQHTC